MINRWALFALALWVGCASEDDHDFDYPLPQMNPDGEVVSKVGPVTITTEEVEERFRSESPMLQSRLREGDAFEKYVDSLVKEELLTQEAYERGLFSDRGVQKALRKALVRTLMQGQVDTLEDSLQVGEDEVVAAYKERFEEFNRPARVRLSALSLERSDRRERSKQKKKFEAMVKQIEERQRNGDMNAFASMAREFTAEHQLDRSVVELGFLTQKNVAQKMGPAAAETIFQDMTIGDVGVFEHEQTLFLVRKEGLRKAVEQPLEKVRRSIENKLRLEKREAAINAWIDEIARRRGVDLTLQNLDLIEVGSNQPQSAPPKTP